MEIGINSTLSSYCKDCITIICFAFNIIFAPLSIAAPENSLPQSCWIFRYRKELLEGILHAKKGFYFSAGQAQW